MTELNNIVYLGPESSFSHICALEIAKLFPSNKLQSVASISGIKEFIKNNEDAFGVFPVENSLGGSVPETLDGILTQKEDIKVLLEFVLKIDHCLLSFGEKSKIQEVRAHYQAFNQCENYLNKNFPDCHKQEFPSNSAAIESLTKLNLNEQKTIASIGSLEAAKKFNIPVLEKQINDSSENYTRFWLIGRESSFNINQKSEQNLCSLAFRIPRDEPGGLMKVLETFASRQINLTKIESRPTKGRLCEYTFFIDFLAPIDWDFQKGQILNIVGSVCSYARFLGYYPVFPAGDNRFES
ncbi:MAG: prephenate dehydratase [Candidatus Caenarcaniphilales bacterium]|nr:prephenate dehydratase [Candidatus Caenarcaniphilales bacterium]